MLRCYTPLLRCGPCNYTFTPQLRSATQLALLRRYLLARRYALALPSLVCSYCVAPLVAPACCVDVRYA